MDHFPIDHSDTPIRLFKSDFLEFFTHISPVAVCVIWIPLAVAAFWMEARTGYMVQAGPWYFIAAIIVGLLLWTLTEYTLHRFLFHFQVKGERAERIFFLFHGVHHAQPKCKTRLVMPPVVSIPMAVIVVGIIHLVFVRLLGLDHWFFPLVGAFIIGYLFYDLIHYATHHFAMRDGIWKRLKRYHMQHHYKDPKAKFGVSSPLWDIVFQTTAS